MPIAPGPSNAAWAMLEPSLRLRPGKTAYVSGGRRVDFAELAGLSFGFAETLRAAGVAPGDRVALALPDGVTLVAAFLGAMLRGAVPAPLNPAFSREMFDFLLDDMQAAFLLADGGSPALDGRLPAGAERVVVDGDDVLALGGPGRIVAPHEPEPGETAFMLYSSGSTGMPKGARHLHASLSASAERYAGEVLGVSEADTLFSASKLFHAYGLGNSLTFALHFGATAILHGDRPAPGDVLGLIARERPSVFFAVPTLYAALLPHLKEADLTSLRLCVSAGEALPKAICDAWRKAGGPEILDGIGSTEALHVFISNRRGDVRPGASGRIVPGYEAAVVDEAGRPVADGEPGRLRVRGPSLSPGYWRRPEKTAETMLPGGWIETGDMYVRDAEGVFAFLGRADDMLKVGGNWVSPADVENALLSHPLVVEAAVTPCDVFGLTRVRAWVALRPGAESGGRMTAELRRHVLSLLPEYMSPSQIRYLDELPKTGAGKVARKLLRERGA